MGGGNQFEYYRINDISIVDLLYTCYESYNIKTTSALTIKEHKAIIGLHQVGTGYDENMEILIECSEGNIPLFLDGVNIINVKDSFKEFCINILFMRDESGHAVPKEEAVEMFNYYFTPITKEEFYKGVNTISILEVMNQIPQE